MPNGSPFAATNPPFPRSLSSKSHANYSRIPTSRRSSFSTYPYFSFRQSKAFVSHDNLKLGFRFKQDLAYLSSTFCSQDCDPGFDKVKPFLDITSVYSYLQHKQSSGRKVPRQSKSLATICQEVLGVSLSKELQRSDWSHRPFSEEQKTYAAADAYCLLDIFNVFQAKVEKEAFEYDGEASLKCFFSWMRSVSATSLSGRRKSKSDVKENLALK